MIDIHHAITTYYCKMKDVAIHEYRTLYPRFILFKTNTIILSPAPS